MTGPAGWSQGYNYDQYGNRTISPAQQTAETPTGFQSNNRVAVWHYDFAGNVVGIPVAGATTQREACVGAILPAVPTNVGMLRTSCYDGEGHMVSETDSTGKTSTYEYDGQGRRVRKTVGTVTTTYVYDAAGQLAAEYGGEVPADSGTRYLFTDHLGSTRLTAKGDGSDPKPLDYYPFGEEVTAGTPRVYPSGAAATELDAKFTGKLRDAESGLDFFEARYYSSVQGRFTSPDTPLLAQQPVDPQSWNLYSYTRNNPLNYVDPSGHQDVMASQCPPADETCVRAENEALTKVASRDFWSGVWKDLKNQAKNLMYGAALAGAGEYAYQIHDAKPKLEAPTNTTEEAGMAFSTAAQLAGGLFSITTAPAKSVTLFRAVSVAEFDQVLESQKFAASANSLGGKWFAETATDASQWGTQLGGAGNFKILQVTLPQNAANSLLRYTKLDGIGPARYGELNQINIPGLRVTPYKPK